MAESEIPAAEVKSQATPSLQFSQNHPDFGFSSSERTTSNPQGTASKARPPARKAELLEAENVDESISPSLLLTVIGISKYQNTLHKDIQALFKYSLYPREYEKNNGGRRWGIRAFLFSREFFSTEVLGWCCPVPAPLRAPWCLYDRMHMHENPQTRC